ncbi:hypothetical protein GCM10010124_34920 [Pilimelia terevasa]|uniref:Uncharacterized protein n=1 Tax=Pilimelia terevasa TaxID=53372 RepID=A0A8J3FKE0_9ACTN|nr:hypothetical protein [Pilimelia terevasa]GGK39114.1 hypothetical protein GCM10010124_34920 [Pilimelia terevasa]
MSRETPTPAPTPPPALTDPALAEDEPDIAGEHQYAKTDRDTAAGRSEREPESPHGLAGMD